MKKVSHSLRERRVPLRKPKVGYTLAWKCSCGTDFGGTKEGMSRTKARELHRVHKLTALSVQEIADGVEEVKPPIIEIPEVDLRDFLDPEAGDDNAIRQDPPKRQSFWQWLFGKRRL